MSHFVKMLLLSIAVASFVAPIGASATEPRTVSCSVAVDFLFDGVLRAPYQQDFVVSPGVVFEDDFSTLTRQGIFTAAASVESGDTIVAINFFRDVGVFDFVDLSTQLTLRGNKETISGSHTYFTSQGAAGNRTTKYRLTCSRSR